MDYKTELEKLDLVDWRQAEDLAQRAQAGDAKAFKAACEAFLPLVLKLSGQFRKTLDDNTLEDLVQVGNLAAINAVQSWRHEGVALSTWVWKYVIRDMRRFLRQENQHHAAIDLDEDFWSELNRAPDENAHANPERVYDQEYVRHIADNVLTNREKEVMTCLYDQGLSMTECAGKLGLTRAGISKAHKTLIRKLQSEVDKSESAGINY